MTDIADRTISITEVIGKIARFGEYALPAAQLVAGLFPGGGTVVTAIQLALPVIKKISQAAPIIAGAIETGRPIIDAIRENGSELLQAYKQLYAIAVNHDPERPETNMTADDVDDTDIVEFCGPVLIGRRWTNDEMQAHWDRMTVTG